MPWIDWNENQVFAACVKSHKMTKKRKRNARDETRRDETMSMLSWCELTENDIIKSTEGAKKPTHVEQKKERKKTIRNTRRFHWRDVESRTDNVTYDDLDFHSFNVCFTMFSLLRLYKICCVFVFSIATTMRSKTFFVFLLFSIASMWFSVCDAFSIPIADSVHISLEFYIIFVLCYQQFCYQFVSFIYFHKSKRIFQSVLFGDLFKSVRKASVRTDVVMFSFPSALTFSLISSF